MTHDRGEKKTARALATTFDKIAGLSAISALFEREPERALRLYYAEELKHEAGPFCAQMARMHRPYRLVGDEELTRIAGTVLHGGIVVAAAPKEVIDVDWAEVSRWAQQGKPLLVLDGVGNPHNLGAIARTLAFFGHERLLVSDHPAQAGLSDAAYRIAEGGLEAVTLYRLAHLPQALKRLQTHYRIVGSALSPTAAPIDDIPPDPRPTLLVLGNEEHGVPPQTLAACELVATIPGSGTVQSLNVSASAAILIYALMRS
ncbi:RNA methyltransferase [Methylococcus sp. EFPC2]|uniref:TrmH family RNA methyltransferase n=1 Tax=Methylococcus sp. EFPC2 TaxID=2812648 RepID=UPI001F07BBF7|nr:RNA methyltransferase [Methylococcus sp. EFPC2]